MNLSDLPTPCLVLDRSILLRNVATMATVARRHGVALRPHMKTAKSIEVCRLATAGQVGGITVSTLAEAEYFAAHGVTDILYAVGITPDKLKAIARLRGQGAEPLVITDDLDMAGAVAAQDAARCLVEIDTGERRGGLPPGDDRLVTVARSLGSRLAGVMTHAGQSYAARSPAALAEVAEAERSGIVAAAERLREAGLSVPIVSMGSSPTAMHAVRLDGVTEIRAGVSMFGDLFQAAIGTHGAADIALRVVASVIGRRPAENLLLIDAGALALSKDRSTAATEADAGYGKVFSLDGRALGTVSTVYQEHGVVVADAGGDSIDRPVGERVTIAPNHACLTAAAHDRYYVTEGGGRVEAIWTRANGW